MSELSKHKPSVKTLGAMRLASIYSRFSPRPNASECESVIHQIEDCKAECDRQGWAWSEDRIFFDEDASGKDWDRAGLWDCLHSLRPGMVLVVREFDRLARDSALGGMIQHMVSSSGAEIHLLYGHNGSDDDPMTAFVRGILALIAEWQGHVIAARARASLKRQFSQGVWPINWAVPYGWRRIDPTKREIEPVPAEQLCLALIKEYREIGKSRTETANELNQAGHTWSNGTPWTASRVWTVIRRERNQKATGRRKPRPHTGFPMLKRKKS